MTSGLDHLEHELAGIATRLEVMERERADEKRSLARTPAGLLVPKNVSPNASPSALQDAIIAKLATRVDELEALLARIAKTQRMQQDAIEELSVLAEWPVAEAAE